MSLYLYRSHRFDDYEIIYNFEVEDLHNYYVSAEMVLVHNYCKRRAFHAAKRSKNIQKSSIPDNIYDEEFTIGANGKYYSPKTYVYGDKFIRDDFGGHLFKDGSSLGKHFNAGKIIDGRCVSNKIHFFYGDGL